MRRCSLVFEMLSFASMANIAHAAEVVDVLWALINASSNTCRFLESANVA